LVNVSSDFYNRVRFYRRANKNEGIYAKEQEIGNIGSEYKYNNGKNQDSFVHHAMCLTYT